MAINVVHKWRLLHRNKAPMIFNQNGRQQGSVWFCLTFCPSSYLLKIKERNFATFLSLELLFLHDFSKTYLIISSYILHTSHDPHYQPKLPVLEQLLSFITIKSNHSYLSSLTHTMHSLSWTRSNVKPEETTLIIALEYNLNCKLGIVSKQFTRYAQWKPNTNTPESSFFLRHEEGSTCT